MPATIDFQHRDLLNDLNQKASVTEKIAFLHRVVRQHCPFVHRIGVAIYDREADTLKTFAHSTEGENPLPNYLCKLSEARSLYQIYLDGRPRLVNDLANIRCQREHSERLKQHGFRASYTIPTYHNGNLMGFVFFNSRETGAFHEESLSYLDMIARLIALLVGMELQQVQTLYGALRMATSFSGHKDPETGAHLERMARFSHLIAHKVAGSYGLDDEFVEGIFWFAPMHDVGKIAIPDHILRKPGKLTDEEFLIMKTHATKGRDMINTMLGNFNLDRSGLAGMIGNIAEFHHENIDGSGYPCGLKGDEIPIEARIVATADVFDALTSERCYKPAWSNEEALEALRAMSTWKLDPICVAALNGELAKIQEIQALYRDEHEPASPTDRANPPRPPRVLKNHSILDAVK